MQILLLLESYNLQAIVTVLYEFVLLSDLLKVVQPHPPPHPKPLTVIWNYPNYHQVV